MSTRKQVLLHGTVLVVIALVALAPVLAALGAKAFADRHGCELDESAVHPCVVRGHDYGPLLTNLFVSLWFGIATIPLGGLVFVAYAVTVAIVYVVRARRRRASGPVVPRI